MAKNEATILTRGEIKLYSGKQLTMNPEKTARQYNVAIKDEDGTDYDLTGYGVKMNICLNSARIDIHKLLMAVDRLSYSCNNASKSISELLKSVHQRLGTKESPFIFKDIATRIKK